MKHLEKLLIFWKETQMPKKRLTYFLPNQLHGEMLEQLQKEGYSSREKSRWICEAVENLLTLENYIDLVSYSDDMEGLSKKDTLTLPEILKGKLSKSSIIIKTKYPSMDGVQSRIIRTAILQRILRKSSPQGKVV